MPPPPFLPYFLSNYDQSLYSSTLGQNLSKAIKILQTSSVGGKYDIIKLFFRYHSRSSSSSLISCLIELKFGTGVNSEALTSNSGQKKSDINTF